MKKPHHCTRRTALLGIVMYLDWWLVDYDE